MRQDAELAAMLGIDDVPTMFVGAPGGSLQDVEPVVGAQPYQQVRDAVV